MKLTRLRELRLRAYLTQEMLSEKAGVTISTISALEAGRENPRISTIRKLAAALDVSPAELAAPPQ